MRADDYAKLAQSYMEVRPRRSEVYKGVPEEEDGPCDDADIAVKIVLSLLSEVREIAAARKATSKEAVLAIMLELKQRWAAVCDRLKHDAFRESLFMAVVGEVDLAAADRRRFRKI